MLKFSIALLMLGSMVFAAPVSAQYAVSGRMAGMAPSVELNLDVLQKLRAQPLPEAAATQQVRKVPVEQPYAPPVRLPADAATHVAASVSSQPPSSTTPFARGESPSHILVDTPPEPVVRPVVRSVVPPVQKKNPPPVQKKAPPKPVATPTVPAPVPVKAVPPVPAAAPAPLVAAPKPISTAPMMIPVKPVPAPLPVPAPAPLPLPKPEKLTPKLPEPLPEPSPEPLPVPKPLPVMPAPQKQAEVRPIVPPPLPQIQKLPEKLTEKLPQPVAIPAPVKTSKPGMPPAPNIDALDFSGMKAPMPEDDLSAVTPQKLLGKPVETMVVKKASTLPEIEVPALPAPHEAASKKPPMLPSISARVDKLFTKDDVKVGVLRDETKIVNPVVPLPKEVPPVKPVAGQVKKLPLPDFDLPKEAPPKLPPPKLPPMDAMIAQKSKPVHAPKNEVVKEPVKKPVQKLLPPPVLPKLSETPLAITPKPKLIAAKPDISNDTVIASLPPLPITDKRPSPDTALAPAMPVLPPPEIGRLKPAPVKPAAVKEALPPKTLPAPVTAPKPMPDIGGRKAASVVFLKDVADLDAGAKSELASLAKTVKEKGSSVRITAYAKGTADEASVARRISLSRALAIRAYLIREGVDQLKINVQAMGHNVASGNPDRADVVVR